MAKIPTSFACAAQTRTVEVLADELLMAAFEVSGEVPRTPSYEGASV
jgi:hypothetical protein